MQASKGNKLWRRLAEDLEKPSRQRRNINISRINRYTDEGEVVVVPGKVLSCGNLDHKLTIAAWQFSQQAMEKIRSANSEVITISALLEKNPKGKGVRIIG